VKRLVRRKKMVRTLARPQTLALGILALILALAALSLARSDTAAAAHDDCALSLFGPASSYGIYASTSGSVDCTTRKNVIHFSIVLTSDGTVVDSEESTCHKAATCWNYAIVNDPPGDQRYCSTVSARIGPHSLTPLTRCEEDSTL
jgi:hypothetical protein